MAHITGTSANANAAVLWKTAICATRTALSSSLMQPWEADVPWNSNVCFPRLQTSNLVLGGRTASTCRRVTMALVRLIMKKSGNVFRVVGMFLGFVSPPARTPHGAYVQMRGRNRIDP